MCAPNEHASRHQLISIYITGWGERLHKGRRRSPAASHSTEASPLQPSTALPNHSPANATGPSQHGATPLGRAAIQLGLAWRTSAASPRLNRSLTPPPPSLGRHRLVNKKPSGSSPSCPMPAGAVRGWPVNQSSSSRESKGPPAQSRGVHATRQPNCVAPKAITWCARNPANKLCGTQGNHVVCTQPGKQTVWHPRQSRGVH